VADAACPEEAIDQRRVRDTALDEFHFLWKVVGKAAGQVVQGQDADAIALEQGPGQVRTDEAGRPGDQRNWSTRHVAHFAVLPWAEDVACGAVDSASGRRRPLNISTQAAANCRGSNLTRDARAAAPASRAVSGAARKYASPSAIAAEVVSRQIQPSSR